MMVESKLEKKVSNVLVSPCRIDILTKLVTKNGLNEDEIKNKMITQSAGVHTHLDKLLDDSIIQILNEKYFITKEGKEVYKILQQIVAQSKKV